MSTDVAAATAATEAIEASTTRATVPADVRRRRLHPPYTEMVQKAIAELKDRSGSSKVAILRYLVDNYQLGDNVNKINTNIRAALRKGVEKGELKQVSGVGASGSFKIAEKRNAAPKVKKPIVKKAKESGARAAAPKRKAAAPKKPVDKARSDKKPAARKPASDAKSSAAKSSSKPKEVKSTKKSSTVSK
ncbi:hypothetical protein Q1695_011028 [Nippostrongylus brasiliensis]|nr:hypothetical protein Q1695_011028 [Nippostrongylus brasiliensis]